MLTCVLKKLSPTALKTFEDAPDRFVRTYVLGVDRMSQDRPMAIGSAFDVYVKAALLNWTMDEFLEQFKKSVAPVHQDWALIEGKRVLEMYKESGAYNALLNEIAGNPIRCEFDTECLLKYPDGYIVPIGGKPDLMFLHDSWGVIVDWKVTGFMSKASPAHGYINYLSEGRDLGCHKGVFIVRDDGMQIGIGANMRPEWMTQLTMYSWAALPPECDALIGIDQLVYSNVDGIYAKGGKQNLKVARFRLKVPEDFQADLRGRLRRAWEMIRSGHYYSNRTREQSDERVEFLANADDMTLWAIEEESRYGKRRS